MPEKTQKKKQCNFRITQEQIDVLHDFCSKNGLKIGWVISESIKTYIKSRQEAPHA